MSLRSDFRSRKFKSRITHLLRVMAPTLVALSFAGVAHAQGTMDFSGAQTLMGTFKTFAMYAGAVICLGGLIFAGIRMMSGRFQFTAPQKELGVANRDLGTIQRIEDGRMTVRMDGKEPRNIELDLSKVRQIDHGYAVTSHSSQGLTSTRVLAHFDTDGPRLLINSRLAYVAISRASEDAHIYTNNAITLGRRLAVDVSKTAAIDLGTDSEGAGHDRTKGGSEKRRASAQDAPSREVKVHEFANSEHRLASVASAYAEQRDRAVVVASNPEERRELTALIRSGLVERGWLSRDNHTVSVAVKRGIGNRRLASNYQTGDQILFRVGSPKEHGIAHGSIVAVAGVDARANLLTVTTTDGSEVTFNPASLRRATDQSQVVRVEQRDIAEGERVRFTSADRDAHIREGDLATIQKVGGGGAMRITHDSGLVQSLRTDKVLPIEHGYVVEAPPARRLDRMVFTGESEQLAQQKSSEFLASHAREISVFQSARSGMQEMIGTKAADALKGPECITPQVAEEIMRPGFGIGR